MPFGLRRGCDLPLRADTPLARRRAVDAARRRAALPEYLEYPAHRVIGRARWREAFRRAVSSRRFPVERSLARLEERFARWLRTPPAPDSIPVARCSRRW